MTNALKTFALALALIGTLTGCGPLPQFDVLVQDTTIDVGRISSTQIAVYDKHTETLQYIDHAPGQHWDAIIFEMEQRGYDVALSAQNKISGWVNADSQRSFTVATR